jgi:hypothetical protein
MASLAKEKGKYYRVHWNFTVNAGPQTHLSEAHHRAGLRLLAVAFDRRERRSKPVSESLGYRGLAANGTISSFDKDGSVFRRGWTRPSALDQDREWHDSHVLVS